MPGSGWFKIVHYSLGWLKWSSDAWFRMVQDISVQFRMIHVEFGIPGSGWFKIVQYSLGWFKYTLEYLVQDSSR